MYVVVSHALLLYPCLVCSFASGNGVPVPYCDIVLCTIILDGFCYQRQVWVLNVVCDTPSAFVPSSLAQFVVGRCGKQEQCLRALFLYGLYQAVYLLLQPFPIEYR